MNRIIYKTDEGGVAVIVPTDESLQSHTIQKIAEKDVPAGKPYKIVSVDDIPSDRTFRNAWEVNESDLTDGVGADYGTGSSREVIDFDLDGNPVIRGEEPEGYYDIEVDFNDNTIEEGEQ